jgi:leucyl aminopeptidase
MELKVLGPEECQALKMGAYLGVAQGSVDPPRFIHLIYKPKSGAQAWGGQPHILPAS